ncbi:MAG: hypothetical protein CM1200mP41_38890 [Gammaproteobacteria bacterium]|nr:MAG: hypothetical protein CM1200mP41_38890 [Gammaproteobacteria bacterium]
MSGIGTRIAGAAETVGTTETMTQFPGAEGIDPELIVALEKQFGFDRPLHERYFTMLWDYLRFELGESYYQNRGVVELIVERFPVSISLGLWSMLLTYLVSIPLGSPKQSVTVVVSTYGAAPLSLSAMRPQAFCSPFS